MKLRISRQAWNDLLDVKAYTLEHYGFGQLERYESLIEAALERIASDPAGGKERPELHPGVLSLHIGQRGHRARHLFFYRIGSDGQAPRPALWRGVLLSTRWNGSFGGGRWMNRPGGTTGRKAPPPSAWPPWRRSGKSIG